MSMNEERELRHVELALRALQPSLGGFDRDQLFFRAGAATARARRWFWPSVAASLALVTILFGAALWRRPVPQVVTEVVYVNVPPPAVQPDTAVPPRHPGSPAAVRDSDATPAWLAQLQQRDQFLRWGPTRLSGTVAGPATTTLPPLERELGLPRGSLRGPQFHQLRMQRSGDSL